MGLHFGTLGMVGFACLVLVAAIQSLRSAPAVRLPLCIIAVTYVGFGIVFFAWNITRWATY